jgi:hypothetical protein
MEVLVMAKKPVTKGQSYAKSGATSVQWVNVTLSDMDVQTLEGWLVSEPDLLTEFVRLVTSNYAVGCKPAADGNGFMATIIGAHRDNRDVSCGVSAYADTPYDALACVMFKFVNCLGGEFTTTPQSHRARFR